MTVDPVGTVQERLLLRPKEAARMLAVSERTLWGSDIPRIRVGKRGIRYALEDLRAYVESRKSRPE